MTANNAAKASYDLSDIVDAISLGKRTWEIDAGKDTIDVQKAMFATIVVKESYDLSGVVDPSCVGVGESNMGKIDCREDTIGIQETMCPRAVVEGPDNLADVIDTVHVARHADEVEHTIGVQERTCSYGPSQDLASIINVPGNCSSYWVTWNSR